MLEYIFPLADSDGKERAYRMSKKDLLPVSLQKPALLVSLRLGTLRSRFSAMLSALVSCHEGSACLLWQPPHALACNMIPSSDVQTNLNGRRFPYMRFSQ